MNESNLNLPILKCLKLQSEGMCDDLSSLWTFISTFSLVQYTFTPFSTFQPLSLKSQLHVSFSIKSSLNHFQFGRLGQVLYLPVS